MRSGWTICLGLVLALPPSPLPAQALPAPVESAGSGTRAASDVPQPGGDGVVDLAPVTVSGAHGPALWRVSRGEHIVWILGTVAPLPRRVHWVSDEVEGLVAQAQEVIVLPTHEITPKIGWLHKLTLLPAAMEARRNPDGALLRERVPAADYARWRRLKARHLGNDAGVERYRPIFAAGTLYREAIEDVGLSYEIPVENTVARLARRHGVAVTAPKVRIVLPEPKQALRAFSQQSIDDVACFTATLDRVEHGLDRMRRLADGWAVGDLAVMRMLAGASDQYLACADALDDAAVARELGLGDLRARKHAAWLAAVDRALANNSVSVALLPVSDLLEEGGVTAALRGRGYAVEEPGAQQVVADASLR